MVNDTSQALLAYQTGSLGVILNGQGFLLVYVLGCLKILGDLGLVGPALSTAATGTASLLSAAVCSKTPYDSIIASLKTYWSISQDPLLPLESRQLKLRQVR